MTTIVELRLLLKDKASAGLLAVSKEQARAAAKAVQMNEHMATKSTAAFAKMSEARERLGIRSEHAVQREIQRTEAAYNRLARSGVLSTNELIRAKEREIKRIRELNAELRTGTSLYTKFQTATTVAAGVGAGGYVIKRAADQAMSFDERLAGMANTAFSSRDVAGRARGMKELEAVINRSVQRGVGGGTRDQAAEALDAMIAKNVLGFERSKQFLPTVMRTASGANAAPVDIANLSSVLVGQNIVSNDRELKTALNMVTAAGQAGGFEIKDQAKWLAQQLPMAGKSGLVGLNGLQQVLAMNQAAILTSGSTDEAGNNVRNLLAKLNSSDTAKDFEKQGRGDLASYLMTQRANGVDSVNAWMNIIDKESANNPQMKVLLDKLNKSKDKTETKETIDALNAIAEGTVVGKYFQDMQATSALLAMRNKPLVADVNAAITKNRTEFGVNDVNYELMQTTASSQVRAAEQAKDAGVKEAMDNLTPTIGTLASQFADLATKHPALAGSAVLATTAITAMAGAAGLASVALGGRNPVGALPKGSGALPKRVLKGGLIGLGSVAAGAGLNYAFGDESPVSRYGNSALTGASAGALVGSVVPIIGTAVGATVGGISGLLYEYINSPAAKEPAKVETTIKVQLADGLKAQSQTTNTNGPVSTLFQTGSIWGTP
ncbi:MAG: phage tail tape measure protein [Methylophilus sp.]